MDQERPVFRSAAVRLSGVAVQICRPLSLQLLRRVLCGMGRWGSAFNGTQAGDMNTNQHGSNGYNL